MHIKQKLKLLKPFLRKIILQNTKYKIENVNPYSYNGLVIVEKFDCESNNKSQVPEP